MSSCGGSINCLSAPSPARARRVTVTSCLTDQAKDERFWTLGARREMVRRLLAEWILEVIMIIIIPRVIMIMMMMMTMMMMIVMMMYLKTGRWPPARPR